MTPNVGPACAHRNGDAVNDRKRTARRQWRPLGVSMAEQPPVSNSLTTIYKYHQHLIPYESCKTARGGPIGRAHDSHAEGMEFESQSSQNNDLQN